MKTSLLLCLLLTGISRADFQTWTNKDGKTAELDLVNVATIGGESIGEFKTKAGTTVKLKESQLATGEADRLKSWRPGDSSTASSKPASTTAAVSSSAPGAASAAGASAFDKILEPTNLIKVNGKHVDHVKDEAKPTKYYVFYYSASWCHPCHQFTPSLVDFYNQNKSDSFEVYLIPHDSDKTAMEGYMKEMNMPWPALQIPKAEKFEKEFKHTIDGIPYIAICNPDGTVVAQGNAGLMLGKLQELAKK